jgi:hypothetical protein
MVMLATAIMPLLRRSLRYGFRKGTRGYRKLKEEEESCIFKGAVCS